MDQVLVRFQDSGPDMGVAPGIWILDLIPRSIFDLTHYKSMGEIRFCE